MACYLEKGQTILFQGDSITDAGRDRANPEGLGGGYVLLTASLLKARYPQLGLRVLNRGISGNRVKDLRARWDADCVDLKPDWVSIMIGINDTWRRFDQNDPTSAAAYEDGLAEILRRAKEECGARLIVLEPFVLPVTQAQATDWRGDLDPKIQAARRQARAYGALYVPLDGLFAAACAGVEPAYWAADGVHPTQAGSALIAEAWLRAVCGA